ncbi:MAG: pantothenate synthase, partial [Chaenotheca gracillima]
MLFKSSVATLSVAATLLSSSAAFDALSNKNLAVYWGSGDNQPRLSHFCADSAIDIIPIGFVNEFPDQAPGGYPGDDFANACWADTFTTPDNKATHLKSHCPTIAEDIPICQGLGKKILLSLGGGAATDASLNDDASGEAFAEFLWKAFGPYDASSTVPRPFGNDVVVDGFDFDVEYNGSVGYAAMIDRLRALYHGDQSRTYYISGAPQCKVPDAQLGPAIRDSWFDFIWIQFYNTAGCSARDFVDGTGHFTYGDYVDIIQNAPNPDVKIFIGLPGGTTAANAGFYITPSEVEDITTSISHQFPDNFGGLMVYEATVAEKNKDAHG